MEKEPGKQEGLYSMRVATRMTGLSADTIRKWEQRYRAIEPIRTEGNTRKFSAENVRKLTLLKEITSQGYSIRDVANLSEERLEQMLLDQERDQGAVGAQVGTELPWLRLIEDYLAAIQSFDARRASYILTRACALLRPTDFLFQVVIPVLTKVGELWEQNKISPAHEHLVSYQVRSVLTTMLQLSSPQQGADQIIVSTPTGHLHELGALIGALLAAYRGFNPVYLGPDLPAKDILIGLDMSRAKLVILSVIIEMNDRYLKKTAQSIRRLSERVTTWVGLPQHHELAKLNTGARYFHSFDELDLALTHKSSLVRD